MTKQQRSTSINEEDDVPAWIVVGGAILVFGGFFYLLYLYLKSIRDSMKKEMEEEEKKKCTCPCPSHHHAS